MLVHLSTYEQILEAAQQMMQSNGYNAFSYADISVQVGIRKATIHYYFPSKSDLGKSVVARYRELFSKKLDQIDSETDNPRCKLKQYVQLYVDVLQKSENICLCGMLAAEINTLPEGVRQEVKLFFLENKAWLTKLLREIHEVQETDETEAQLLLAALEGTMLISRTYRTPTQFQSIVQRLLKSLDLD
jgi:TetR/AcrR family transcriptional repressor of nem operon